MSYKIGLFRRDKNKRIYVSQMMYDDIIGIAITPAERQSFENGEKNIIEILQDRKGE